MRLTEEGQYCLTKFDTILESIELLKQEVTHRKGVIRGQIRITSPLVVGRYYFQPIISDFLTEYPNVQLSWLMVDRHVNLVEEEIDLAIRIDRLPESGLIARPLGQIRVKVVASPNYIAKYGRPKHPKELINHICITDNTIRTPKRWIFKKNKMNFILR